MRGICGRERRRCTLFSFDQGSRSLLRRETRETHRVLRRGYVNVIRKFRSSRSNLDFPIYFGRWSLGCVFLRSTIELRRVLP